MKTRKRPIITHSKNNDKRAENHILSSRIRYSLIEKLRVKGCTFSEIGACAGLSKWAVRDILASKNPELFTLDEWTKNQEHFVGTLAATNHAAAQALMDRFVSQIALGEEPTHKYAETACRLVTANASLLDRLRLMKGQSTANYSHFLTHYLTAEDQPPGGPTLGVSNQTNLSVPNSVHEGIPALPSPDAQTTYSNERAREEQFPGQPRS